MTWAPTTLTIASNEVTGVSGTHTVYKYELERNTGSLIETFVSNVVNSTVFYDQTLSITLAKQSKNATQEIKSLLQGRWIIFIQDVNNNVFMMGHLTGAEVTAGAKETGTNIGDFTGYRLEFKAPEPMPTYHVQLDTDFDTTIEGLSVSPGVITVS